MNLTIELTLDGQVYQLFPEAPRPDPNVAIQFSDHFPTLKEYEAAYIKHVMNVAQSFREAARILGIDQATLYRWRNKNGVKTKSNWRAL